VEGGYFEEEQVASDTIELVLAGGFLAYRRCMYRCKSAAHQRRSEIPPHRRYAELRMRCGRLCSFIEIKYFSKTTFTVYSPRHPTADEDAK
jgi:hypothetical protein